VILIQDYSWSKSERQKVCNAKVYILWLLCIMIFQNNVEHCAVSLQHLSFLSSSDLEIYVSAVMLHNNQSNSTITQVFVNVTTVHR